MAAHFEDGGIRFRYPENWKLEREENEAGLTVSVQSPDTAFIMVCFRDDEATPDEMARVVQYAQVHPLLGYKRLTWAMLPSLMLAVLRLAVNRIG